MNLNEKIIARLLQTFKVEAREHIQLISNKLIVYEKEKNPEERASLIEEIYRAAHSLKGAARAVGLSQIVSLCQTVEDVFSGFKKKTIKEVKELFDSSLKAVNMISDFVEEESAEKKDAMESEILRLSDELNHLYLIHHIPEEEEEKEAGEIPKESSVQKEKTSLAEKKEDSTADSSIKDSDEKKIKKISRKQKEEKPVKKEEKKTEEVKSEKVKSVTPPNNSRVINNLGKEKVEIPDQIRISVDKIEEIQKRTEEFIPVRQAFSQHKDELRAINLLFDTWRKKWNKSQLNYNRIYDLITEMDESDPDASALKNILNFLEYNDEFVNDISDLLNGMEMKFSNRYDDFKNLLYQIGDDIKEVLMLPFSSLTDQFPLMIRDIANELGKEVEFNIEGDTIEIDKRVLDELKDPLIHLLRNSIDHGIENPSNRIEAGKPRTGKVSLHIKPTEGNKVEIKISDDGAGISLEKIKASALKKNLVEENELKNYSEKQILDLIFLSDLSTAKVITDLSGRGLGMAIVKEKVEKLGGEISISTEEGVGSVFKILIPLTSATVRGILIKCGNFKAYIKSDDLVAAIRFKKENIVTVENKDTIKYANRHVGILSLSDIWEIPSKAGEDGYFNAVICKRGGKEIALIVDEIIGDKEILIKNFNPQIQKLKYYESCSIAGDGSIIPVLNLSDILREASGGTTIRKEIKTEEGEEKPVKNILVVDDSITSRVLIRDILESAGYQVKTAVDGKEAWNEVRSTRFDLIVSDVEMPRMNGFEFTKLVKSSEKFGNIPVILVTALSKREDMEKGIDAGADAYIVKSDFEQSNLLDTVERLI